MYTRVKLYPHLCFFYKSKLKMHKRSHCKTQKSETCRRKYRKNCRIEAWVIPTENKPGSSGNTTKNWKTGLHKIKSSVEWRVQSSEKTSWRMDGRHTSCTLGRGLISTAYKEFKGQPKTTNDSVNKWTDEMESFLRWKANGQYTYENTFNDSYPSRK